MKKFLILFLAILSFSVYAEENNAPAIVQASDSCVTVGNVTATLSESDTEVLVYIANQNAYKVSVAYTVYALTPDYRKVQAGGGNVALSRYDGSISGPYRETVRIRKGEGLHSYSVEISPMRCE